MEEFLSNAEDYNHVEPREVFSHIGRTTLRQFNVYLSERNKGKYLIRRKQTNPF